MKLLFIVMFTLSFVVMPTYSFAKSYSVEEVSSKIDWHLYIAEGTDVYGQIPIIKGQFDFEKNSGELSFDLAKTKSWELDEGKKDYSDARDDRIRSITSSKKNIPVFSVTSISGYNNSKSSSNIELTGKLSLNGNTKNIVIKAIVEKIENELKLKAKYQLKWEDFKIDNPVIWILRVTKKPQEFITLSFDLTLK